MARMNVGRAAGTDQRAETGFCVPTSGTPGLERRGRVDKVRQAAGKLLDNYVLAAVFVVLAVLCVTGVGVPVLSCILGLALCVIGCTQKHYRADIYIAAPLMAFNICSIISTWISQGNALAGYAPIQMVIPVIYLLVSALPVGSVRRLQQLCAAWFGFVSAAGILQVLCGPQEGAHRLSGMLYNPNAMGIFLVLGWFAVLGLKPGQGRFGAVLPSVEPVVLAALAMTLSMGSFVAMAAGILFVLVRKYGQERSWRAVFCLACGLLSRAAIGMSAGLLAYVAISRTDVRLLAWLVFAYIIVLSACWAECLRFLDSVRWVPVVLSASGTLVALAAVFLRPSAIATFAERIEMMKNGLNYILVNPLFGIGPFQWRMLNMADADKYFNTWHIHNVLIHVAVEFGWIAAAALVMIAIRLFTKHKGVYQKAALAAFVCHNMIDTSFFLVGVTCILVALLFDVDADAGPDSSAQSCRYARPMLVLAGIFFAYILLCIPM